MPDRIIRDVLRPVDKATVGAHPFASTSRPNVHIIAIHTLQEDEVPTSHSGDTMEMSLSAPVKQSARLHHRLKRQMAALGSSVDWLVLV
jgi:hypothetical protein